MPSAIPYTRFSSDRQKHGSSIARQEVMISDWIKRHPDYNLSTLKFSDLGKSGYHGDHIKEAGGFGKLLKAVSDGFIKGGDVVLVEAIDRTGRLPALEMLSRVITPILQAGVSIVTLDDNTTYSKESANTAQIFLLVAKIQAAHGYSETLSRRVSESYKKRRRDAVEHGVVPKRMTPVWLTAEGAVREDVAPWIKTAFELYVSGVGKYTIAQRMRESGVERLSRTSGPTVDGWLQNKAAIGVWSTLEGTDDHQELNVYPAVIEPALFYKAQMHRERVSTKRQSKTAKHFLVGLVKCSECGKNFIMKHRDGKPHSMSCLTRQNKTGCSNGKTIPIPVINTVYRHTSATAAFEAISSLHTNVNEQEIAVKEGQLQEASKRIAGYVQTLAATGYIPELANKLQESQEQRTQLEAELVILKSTVSAPASGWQAQGDVWKLEREDEQRLSAMLRGVGYNITISADGSMRSSHSTVDYSYAGVDRATGSYKLRERTCGEVDKMHMVLREEAWPYSEPFQEVEGSATQDEADRENMLMQYGQAT